VRLSVEVPFEELKPSLDKAYKSVAQQIRVPGFRPGRVPPAIVDQRVGRAFVLEQAVNDAVPQRYADAVREHEVKVVGQPDINVTKYDDKDGVEFTAEVDIRPEMLLPAFEDLAVTVDDIEISDSDVDEQVDGLRERFATLKGVERPVADGDYVSIDLHATVDGQDVEGGSANGLSYQVGSGELLEGIDQALIGMSSGDEKTFSTELANGEYAGREAEVKVTVRSVKEKELPPADDDFAQLASEFDTLEELRADTRQRVERVRRIQQGLEARDKVLEALLEAVDIPLPEKIVDAEKEYRAQEMDEQLQQANLTREAYAQQQDRSLEELDAEVAEAAERAVKTQLVLDAVADAEQIGVTDQELTGEVVTRAQRYGVNPNEYAQRLVDAGQLPVLAGEIRRGKALALVVEAARITDASGEPVDLKQIGGGETVVAADDEVEHDHNHDHDAGDGEAVEAAGAVES
ncbi:MAG: trigger factor, partial [Mycobacteriales bacterium]